MYLSQTMILKILTMASAAAVSVSSSVVDSDFDKKSLFAMGTSLNNSLLKLLGRTFERLENDILKDIDNKTTFVLGQVNKDKSSLEQRLVSEIGQVNKDKSSLEQRLVSERRELIDIICQLHPCTEWEAWSGCSAKFKGTFGAQTRSRTCDVKASKLCSSTGQEQKETDTMICEGTQCPTNYTATTNGYCIGVHRDITRNWISAQATCKQEGGYLMNVDSQLKKLALDHILPDFNFWIDGTRVLPTGKWRYEYGPQDSTYSNWKSGKPASTDIHLHPRTDGTGLVHHVQLVIILFVNCFSTRFNFNLVHNGGTRTLVVNPRSPT